jgi:hypothetical protein
MKSESDGAGSGEGAKGKKEYAAPALVVYGDIRMITQSVGRTGVMDGAGPPNSKTRP